MHDLPTSASTWTTSAATLEDQGVASFHKSFADLLVTLDAKARRVTQQ